MDQRDFDRLARQIGSGVSRRGALKTLVGMVVGGTAGALGLNRTKAAHQLRAVGNACVSNSDCASGLCVQESRTRKICHCGSVLDCPQAVDGCHAATCSAGACGISVNLGASCDDGLKCTTGDVCQANGGCAGTPVACPPASSDCFTPGSCQPADGLCAAETYRGDGATCADGVCFSQVCCTPDCDGHCGGPDSCGGTCPAGCPKCHTCTDYLCVPNSDPTPPGGLGSVCCDGVLTMDDDNCGACGQACGENCSCTVSLTSDEGTRTAFCVRDSCYEDYDCPDGYTCEDYQCRAGKCFTGQTCPAGGLCDYGANCLACCGDSCPSL